MYREENIVRDLHFYTFPQRMQIVAKEEYFARFPEYEIPPGKYHPFERPHPALLQEIEELRSMLNAFSRSHEPKQ